MYQNLSMVQIQIDFGALIGKETNFQQQNIEIIRLSFCLKIEFIFRFETSK